ncbi:lytic transglycosylase domain-containing protein [Brucella sp. NBRC 12950]|uniref:lytic transglycosylase domain-containing protein n=1 Tax=Brucella sp. NBRC 12950 TaxID=2994518 RepID=UPI0024A3CAF0|nr:lytic transglycosylase domain-containing protein [Brucella sp. NBRC 12950]GLU28258.1 hypothetical protein Brsp01_34910 [Brucella sp. NBRC 12950]
MIGADFLIACAPNIAPETLQQIIQVESKGDPLAIHVNKAGPTSRPTDKAHAAALAISYTAQGYSVDLGLMQVNNRNLEKLGYTIADMFEPCKNIAAGARVLSAFFGSAIKANKDPQLALRAALSAYNTGSFQRGFYNGYLARYGFTAAVKPAQVRFVNIYTADSLIYRRSNQEQEREDRIMKHRTIVGEPTASGIRTVPVVSRSANDAHTPGVMIEHMPDEAEVLGAFRETAIGHQDAWIGNESLGHDEPVELLKGKNISADPVSDQRGR